MDPFSLVLLQISEDLLPDNVNAMKFLCQAQIGKKKLEQINKGTELFECLQQMNKIGPDNTDFLKDLLNSIKRADLHERLSNFETCGPGPQEVRLDPNVRAKLDIATDELSEQLGRNWRRYGRKLGITDAKLDQISAKHPFDLREQAVTLLREWRKMQGADAKVDGLIKALRSCELNLTADQLIRRLAQEEQKQ
ncbi:protein FADD [Conger conger]|uniref:protein FADD n=1 Tax=Conger conger TaxID=82655 RepID=UPI002A59B542|nr:protein FADD [Conger conger]